VKQSSPASDTFAGTLLEVIQTLEEESVVRPARADLVRWAVGALSRRAGKKLPPDLARRCRQLDGMKPGEVRDLLRDAHARFRAPARPDAQAVLDCVVREVLERIDPHAVWGRPALYCWGTAQVGLKLKIDPRTKLPQVITPAFNGPAYRAGIRAGDRITEIVRLSEPDGNGQRAPAHSVLTGGLSLESLSSLLSGEQGTTVLLIVRKSGARKAQRVEVERGDGTSETVLGWRRKPNDCRDHWLDRRNKIVYIRISSFQRRTAADLARVLDDLTGRGLKGLVLDLRFNPGGLLDIALRTAELFLEKGTIVQITSPGASQTRFEVKRPGRFRKLPLACLVNGETASSAEVVAAALQDHKRALIVGQRSGGKGSIQNQWDNFTFGSDRQLTLTTALFLRPGGQKLDRMAVPGYPSRDWGVHPDRGFHVTLTAADQARLHASFADAEILRHPDDRAGQPRFVDRQLDQALTRLRVLSRGARESEPVH
jgi:carboxyl-terminal processing protease